MADTRRSRQDPTVSEGAVSAESGSFSTSSTQHDAATKKLYMDQHHDVVVGDDVHLNGSVFTIASGVYAWSGIAPDGSAFDLKNNAMPGPSFVVEHVGDYVVTLPTDDGEATITVHVSEP